MPVAGMQNQVMLQDERGDPDVVGWDRRSLDSKLLIKIRVVMGRLVIGEEDFDSHGEEEVPQRSLVLRLLPSADKAGPELGDYDERQDDELRVLQQRQRLDVTSAKIGIAIRVESKSQRQRSSST